MQLARACYARTEVVTTTYNYAYSLDQIDLLLHSGALHSNVRHYHFRTGRSASLRDGMVVTHSTKSTDRADSIGRPAPAYPAHDLLGGAFSCPLTSWSRWILSYWPAKDGYFAPIFGRHSQHVPPHTQVPHLQSLAGYWDFVNPRTPTTRHDAVRSRVSNCVHAHRNSD